MNSTVPQNVIMYCRRSSDSEDRQVLSIDSQVKELQQFAEQRNLNIIEVLTESKSAKAPGRPVFSNMMEHLQSAKINGILCWKLDRLARNPVDGGAVIWAVKDGGIEIITPSQTYSHESENTLLMYVEFGMAQKFIDDLGKNASRGMKTKAELGWYPAPAPIGYKNTPTREKGFKTILKDSVRFGLCRKACEEVLSGRIAADVWRKAVNEWKLTTRQGRSLSRSNFYRMLTNPFYYGEFEWPSGSGNWYKGKHTPMITREEFDLVQKQLGSKGKPLPRHYEFDYTGLIRCGECGCMITATQKTKHYPRTHRTATYVYYHCSKKNLSHQCTQSPIRGRDLKVQIDGVVNSIHVEKDFLDWARKWLKVLHGNEVQDRTTIYKSQQQAFNEMQEKLDRLLDLRVDGVIDTKTYELKKRALERERESLKEKLDDTEHRADCWHKRVEDTLEFAYALRERFDGANPKDKRWLLSILGSNFEYKDGKVRIILQKPYQALAEQEKWPDRVKDWLEPVEYTDVLRKYPDLQPANPVWLPLWDAIRTMNSRQHIATTSPVS